ncbi:MAG: protein translocase subunit SecF [Alphaproteobacteria bacterium]|nr:protein translocase subunit SecF [Alphaproteobacteria bacterium]
MKRIRLVPDGTNIDFMKARFICFALGIVVILGSFVLFATKGLNYGIDFRGGTLIELRMPTTPDFGELRSKVGNLGLGEVTLQGFGEPTDVLVRVQAQEDGEKGNQRAIATLREAMGSDVDFRRVESVGPTVGQELRAAGLWAVIAAVVAILAYVTMRFEWQFGLGAVIGLLHDVIAIVGLFSLLGLDFDLTTLAAILTMGGYSINDKVVVYDRIRENLRKFRKMDLAELINKSLNDTLSRTTMTAITVFLSIAAMLIFGGPVIRTFNLAMMAGVVIGTYSSIFVSAPVLLYLGLKRTSVVAKDEATPARP